MRFSAMKAMIHCMAESAMIATTAAPGRMTPLPPRIGFCRTPIWEEAEPETMAALDRARGALLAAGARIDDIAVPEAHRSLAAAQNTIMSYEMTQALAEERRSHRVRSARISHGSDWPKASLAGKGKARSPVVLNQGGGRDD